MSLARRATAVVVVAVALLGACGGAPEPVRVPTADIPAAAPSVAIEIEGAGFGEDDALRVALDVPLLRATSEGRALADALDWAPRVRELGTACGADLMRDPSWLAAYGGDLGTSGTNVVVVKLPSASDVRGSRESVSSDEITRPLPDVVVVGPRGKKALVARVLRELGESGLARNEVLRLRVLHPSRRWKVMPEELQRLDVAVRSATPGLEVVADGQCETEEACAQAATAIRDTVKASNKTLVHAMVRGLLDPLEREGTDGGPGVRARGSRLEARFSPSPDQMIAVANVLAAMFGAPP